MSKDRVPLHPFVKAVLDRIAEGPDGVEMKKPDLGLAAKRLRDAPADQREEISKQLLALYQRFHKVNADAVCGQLAYLVVVAIGGPAAARRLAEAGMAPEELKKVLGKAEGDRTKQIHADKPKTQKGVGMRKR